VTAPRPGETTEWAPERGGAAAMEKSTVGRPAAVRAGKSMTTVHEDAFLLTHIPQLPPSGHITLAIHRTYNGKVRWR
jgi:hypothetical protein